MNTPQTSTSRHEIRDKIIQLESLMLQMPQIEIPIQHHFAPGLYLREMAMPKGSTVVGKIHKTEHLCIVAKGSVSVGDTTYSAPSVIHSMPGTKRAIYAHEDSVWINVHHNPTNEQDPVKIDDVFVTDTFEQFLEFSKTLQIQGGV